MIKVNRNEVEMEGFLLILMAEAAVAVNSVAKSIVKTAGPDSDMQKRFRETVNMSIDAAEGKHIESRGAAMENLKELREILATVKKILNEGAGDGSAHEDHKE